jgi:hypothetical protein
MLFSALWETALQQHVPVGVNARLAASACPTSATWLDSCRQLRFDPASVGAYLAMHGARQAGPEPAKAAIQRT